MKILILSVGRCGSSKLSSGLTTLLGYTGSNEPFNPTLGTQHKFVPYTYPDEVPSNSVMKCIYGYDHLPSLGDWQPGFNILYNNKFFLKFAKRFDKVILQSRRNVTELAESVQNSELTGNFGTEYTYGNQTLHKRHMVFSHRMTMNFGLFARKIGKPITYYEDLYSKDRNVSEQAVKIFDIPQLNFDALYDNYLDPKFKLRRD